MKREKCEGARSGATKSPRQDNKESYHESKKQIKAIMELRETRRKQKDKPKLCRRQVIRKMADGRGKGGRRNGESAEEGNGRERRQKNHVRQTSDQTKT